MSAALFVSVLGKKKQKKNGLVLMSATVASCRKQGCRKTCQEDDHWVGETAWTAQRVWTGLRCLAGQNYTGAGDSGGTAWEDGQEQKKVLSIVAQMLDRRQQHLGGWLGGETGPCGQMNETF